MYLYLSPPAGTLLALSLITSYTVRLIELKHMSMTRVDDDCTVTVTSSAQHTIA